MWYADLVATFFLIILVEIYQELKRTFDVGTVVMFKLLKINQ